MKKVVLIIYLLFTGLQAQYALVNVPVASLWKRPCDKNKYVKPPVLKGSEAACVLKTQLLWGERVFVVKEHKKKKDWIKIIAEEQRVFDEKTNHWRGFQGWIKKSSLVFVDTLPAYNAVVIKKHTNLYETIDMQKKDILHKLSAGTLLNVIGCMEKKAAFAALPAGGFGFIRSCDVRFIHEIDLSAFNFRKALCQAAVLFNGSPYCWGGRSSYHEDVQLVTSVDCSALVELVYRMCGIRVPRFAHHQYLFSKKIKPKDVQPGDLVFGAYQDDKWSRISHVWMYLGNNLLIESTGKKGVEKVRIVSCSEMFGLKIGDMKTGNLYKNIAVFFGSFLANKKKLWKSHFALMGLEV